MEKLDTCRLTPRRLQVVGFRFSLLNTTAVTFTRQCFLSIWFFSGSTNSKARRKRASQGSRGQDVESGIHSYTTFDSGQETAAECHNETIPISDAEFYSYPFNPLQTTTKKIKKKGTLSSSIHPMEESMNRSIAALKKKRKIHAELLGAHLPKCVCWGRILECDSASDTIMGQKKLKRDIFARQVESDQESAKDSNSFSVGDNKDAESSSYGCSSPCHSCPKAHEWSESTSTEIDMYTSDSSSFINPSSSGESQSFSISEDTDHIHNNYEDHLLELQGYCSECKTDGFDHCKDLDDDHLLYSNGLATGNYVFSSVILPVNQDIQQGTKKLTIDKEFEQYFSSLML